jgi:hypothetical protein
MPTPDWLSIFEAKALADALTRSGHSVSERTAQRWKAGETSPKPQDVRAILALLDTTKEALPLWAEGLEKKLDSVLENQAVIIGALPSEKAELLIARLEELLPPPGAASPEGTGSPDRVEGSQPIQGDG